jgi:hypothetical protein
MVITPHLNNGMAGSFTFTHDCVAVKIDLSEPLHPETNFQRLSPSLLEGATVTNVWQWLVHGRKGTAGFTAQSGFRPRVKKGANKGPGAGDGFIIAEAQKVLETQGIAGLTEFCTAKARELVDEYVRPSLAIAA